jgi:hypothetical protein
VAVLVEHLDGLVTKALRWVLAVVVQVVYLTGQTTLLVVETIQLQLVVVVQHQTTEL